MLSSIRRASLCVAITAAVGVHAIVLNVSDDDSIRSAASTIAYGMMKYYTGNQTGKEPGLLPAPYYWWEAGAMWGGMVEYWHYTGDTSYNDVVSQAILAQASPTKDFMMPEEAGQLGNDDQAFWGLTAMTAAERSFPLPSTSDVSYIELAKGVFDDMAGPRWNTSTCNGGLQWQFNPNNAGFYYKSSIANGGFFQLAARLARYTGNSTYSAWAEKTYAWMARIGLIDSDGNVYDGTDSKINCTGIDHDQWTYNAGTMLLGAAVLANISTPSPPTTAINSNSTSIWLSRALAILTRAQQTFSTPYPNATNILYEPKCETAPSPTCDADQLSFKAYLSRWLAASAEALPALEPHVSALLTASAQGAALACSGMDASVCGQKWYVGGWDGTAGGVGQQMAAMEAIQGLLG